LPQLHDMRPLLLLHGALGSASQLDLLKSSLQTAGYKVLSLNFSGHGGIPFRKSFGIETFADDILRFLEDERISAVDIFGYSMGGYVALWLALHHPERVGAIATLGTKFDWSETSAEKEIKKLDADKIQLKVPAFARILEHRHAPNNWKELLQQTSAMMQVMGKEPLLKDELLQQIRNEVFVMLGEEDDMADMVCSAKVSELLPHARFLLLEDTPHPIEKVDVARLTQLLTDFFKMKTEAPVKPL
jgi:pimeloyl-ACP methyl ester carboxylesterase